MPDRDEEINVIKEAQATVGGKQVWAKPDQPFDVRAVESFLFGMKKQLMEGGYSNQQLWVDTSDAAVSVDGAKVMHGNVSAGKFGIQWCNLEWAAWKLLQEAAELKELISKTQVKLDKGGGKGKGKGKKKRNSSSDE